jgi:hypothetical protein
MTDGARRKELRAQYKQTHPQAGVYRIVNRRNGKVLLGSSPNLPSVRSKLEFAGSTGMLGALDHRLVSDARQFGVDAFSLEILEALEIGPEMTAERIREDLAVLEALWREKQDPALLY